MKRGETSLLQGSIPYALPVGTLIAGYEIVRALGAGGFGITYEGYNRIIKRRVAIKEFFPRGMASRESATHIVFSQHDSEVAQWALKRFEESTAALAELEHKHILQVLNYISSHGTGYMVMEHVDGLTFEEWLKLKPTLPTLQDLRIVLEPIFDALEYIHVRNILHRDIAPDNIMIAKDGRPVLIDFGAIKLIEEQTRIKTGGSYAIGKRYYSPPEQLSGNTKLDARTDLYALAAVIYRALSGEPPIDADHRRGEVIDGGSDPYVAIGQTNARALSPEQSKVIDRALSLRRDERPINLAEFRSAFGWTNEPRSDQTRHVVEATDTGILEPLKVETIIAVSESTIATKAVYNRPTGDSEYKHYSQPGVPAIDDYGSEITAPRIVGKRGWWGIAAFVVLLLAAYVFGEVYFVSPEALRSETPSTTTTSPPASNSGDLNDLNDLTGLRRLEGQVVTLPLSHLNASKNKEAVFSYDIAVRLLAEGKIDQGYLWLADTIIRDPEFALAYYGRGVLWLRSGNKLNANADFQAAKKFEQKLENDQRVQLEEYLRLTQQ